MGRSQTTTGAAFDAGSSSGSKPGVALTTQRFESVTIPMTAPSRSHFAQIVEHPLLFARLRDEEHPLLRLGQEDLVGGHLLRAARHLVEIDLDAVLRAPRHLDARRREPRGPHVLNPREHVGGEQLEARLDEELAHERIADLHRRPLRRPFGRELVRRHGRAVDAVAPRLGADVEDLISDPFGAPVEDAIGGRDAARERVDQNVAIVAGIELHLAADGRHTDAVAIAADAGDDAAQQLWGARVGRRGCRSGAS